ncbi:MAG: hypothetical protein RIT02_686 [Planctomycetota bacterium]
MACIRPQILAENPEIPDKTLSVRSDALSPRRPSREGEAPAKPQDCHPPLLDRSCQQAPQVGTNTTELFASAGDRPPETGSWRPTWDAWAARRSNGRRAPPRRSKKSRRRSSEHLRPFNVPGGIRTCDLRFRKPTLYPAELRGLQGANSSLLTPDCSIVPNCTANSNPPGPHDTIDMRRVR